MGWELDTSQLLVKLSLNKLFLRLQKVDIVINSKAQGRKVLQSITEILDTMTVLVNM